MVKKDSKKFNDTLVCYAILILTIGLIGGAILIVVGVKCDTLDTIGYCIFGTTVILMFFTISFMLYLVARKEELKKLFN